MANLKFNERAGLEKLFGMASGYVLKFSDRSLQRFVGESTEKDILTSEYEDKGTSKANRLRTFWERESDQLVGKLITDLLEHWHLNKDATADDDLYRYCVRVAKRLSNATAADRSASASAQKSSAPGGGNDPPIAITPEDRNFAQMAIEQARQSIPEKDQRFHPKVGAVVVKDGKVLGMAHRGEEVGCRAEFLVLERKLADASLAGATVYTTLEPCTERNHPKVPCAHRLVERKVKRVVIGMLDPNPAIRGSGQLILRDANIITDLFPHDLMAQIEELNRDFIRLHKAAGAGAGAKPRAKPRAKPLKAPPSGIQTPVPIAIAITNEASRQGANGDRKTLDDLLRVLPSGGAIRFLRTNDFGGTFNREDLHDLRLFVHERCGPDHEFIDPELEILRQDLQKKSSSFMEYIALHTWCVDAPADSKYSSIPQEWESEQPERFQNTVATIHSQAEAICEQYDQLIRSARRKLLG